MRQAHVAAPALPRRTSPVSILVLMPGLLVACSGRSLDIGGPMSVSGSDAGSGEASTSASVGGTSDDASLAVGAPVPPGDFCREYTLAVCKAVKSCCGSAPAGVFDETTCISVVRGQCDGSLTSAATVGAAYVPELGASCSAKAASEVCAAQVWDVPTRCPGLFRGTAPEGTSCSTYYRSCAEGLGCAPQPLPPQNPCVGPQPCDPASSYACTKLPTAGKPCFQGYVNGVVAVCADGFACKSNVCQAVHFAAPGASCNDIEQCKKGLFCDGASSTCQAPRGDAEPCADHTNCASDVCTDHVCTPATPKPIPFCKRTRN